MFTKLMCDDAQNLFENNAGGLYLEVLFQFNVVK